MGVFYMMSVLLRAGVLLKSEILEYESGTVMKVGPGI